MKRIIPEKYGKFYLDKEIIETIEENENLVHIGTEVIKDKVFNNANRLDVGCFIGVYFKNDDIIYVRFRHPDPNKYRYSVCEVFMRKEGD